MTCPFLCEEFKMQTENKTVAGDLKEKYEKHNQDKVATNKVERDRDRTSEDVILVICFYLEN